jgi:hypothetical protein
MRVSRVRVALLFTLCIVPPTATHAQRRPIVDRLSLIEVGRLGEENGPIAFNAIGQIIQNGNRLFLTEPRDAQIVVIDLATKKVDRIGHRGHGPGEFQLIGNIGFLGDTLWVTDVGTSRTTYFGPNWRVLSTFTFIESQPIGLLSDGSVVATSAIYPSEYENRVEYFRLTRDERLLDTLISRPMNAHAFVRIPLGNGMLVSSNPYTTDPLVFSDPFGKRTAIVFRDGPRGNEVMVELKSPGRPASRTVLSIPSQSIDKSSWEDQIRLKVPARMRNAIIFPVEGRPASWVPVQAAILANNGDVWLAGAGRSWMIVRPDRGLIATVESPLGVTIRTVYGDSVWATATDQNDVPIVIRMELRKSK